MIYTSYFAKHKKGADDKTAYLSIAVGNPKYEVPYEIIDIKILKPYGIFGKYHGEEYKKKYFERLNSYGVDKIMHEIERLSKGKENVLLMCHEKNKMDCHRSMFAEWWLEQTGEIIEEWGEEKPKEEFTQLKFFDII